MRNGIVNHGFTLIEILVVLTIIGVLLSLVTPRYFDSIDRSKETVLRHDLQVMRNAIDHYVSDRNAYPDALEDLVEAHYLRAVPVDPITDRKDTWILVAPEDAFYEGNVADVHSGSEQMASDGSLYVEW